MGGVKSDGVGQTSQTERETSRGTFHVPTPEGARAFEGLFFGSEVRRAGFTNKVRDRQHEHRAPFETASICDGVMTYLPLIYARIPAWGKQVSGRCTVYR